MHRGEVGAPARQLPHGRTHGLRNVEELEIDENAFAAIAQRKGAPLIDFDIPSKITTTDANYWDPRHYRIAIAERIVDDIERALATRQDDPDGDWRYVDGPRTAAIATN